MKEPERGIYRTTCTPHIRLGANGQAEEMFGRTGGKCSLKMIRRCVKKKGFWCQQEVEQDMASYNIYHCRNQLCELFHHSLEACLLGPLDKVACPLQVSFHLPLWDRLFEVAQAVQGVFREWQIRIQ